MLRTKQGKLAHSVAKPSGCVCIFEAAVGFCRGPSAESARSHQPQRPHLIRHRRGAKGVVWREQQTGNKRHHHRLMWPLNNHRFRLGPPNRHHHQLMWPFNNHHFWLGPPNRHHHRLMWPPSNRFRCHQSHLHCHHRQLHQQPRPQRHHWPRRSQQALHHHQQQQRPRLHRRLHVLHNGPTQWRTRGGQTPPPPATKTAAGAGSLRPHAPPPVAKTAAPPAAVALAPSKPAACVAQRPDAVANSRLTEAPSPLHLAKTATLPAAKPPALQPLAPQKPAGSMPPPPAAVANSPADPPPVALTAAPPQAAATGRAGAKAPVAKFALGCRRERVGISNIEFAPTKGGRRAVCKVCERSIAAGSARFLWRSRAAPPHWIHWECVVEFPTSQTCCPICWS